MILLSLSIVLTACSSPTPAAPAAAAPAGIWTEISIQQAAERRTAGAFMLDVREPDEWQQIHIPGATLIPLGELPQRLSELPKDQEIVVVCRSGNRSQAGAEVLAKAGFSGVTSMAGGMNQWSAAGLPVESGD
jgi:rhodanese-related sulfurtransferase